MLRGRASTRGPKVERGLTRRKTFGLHLDREARWNGVTQSISDAPLDPLHMGVLVVRHRERHKRMPLALGADNSKVADDLVDGVAVLLLHPSDRLVIPPHAGQHIPASPNRPLAEQMRHG